MRQSHASHDESRFSHNTCQPEEQGRGQPQLFDQVMTTKRLTRFSTLRISARQTQSRKLDYHLVVEGSCFDVSVDHIQLIGSSAVEPHVTCDHRQHKRDRSCTLNDVRDPRAAVNTSPRMPGLTQCFLLLRWRLLIASTPRAETEWFSHRCLSSRCSNHRDRPADAVEDQPLELIRPAATGRTLAMNGGRWCHRWRRGRLSHPERY